MKLTDTDIEQYYEAFEKSEKIECSEQFYDNLLNKIKQNESKSRNFASAKYIQNNYSLVTIICLLILNFSSMFIIISNKNNNKEIRKNTIANFAKTYAIDQSNYNLLTFKK